MNWDRIEGNWKQLRGKVREKWGKLTDDQVDVVVEQRAFRPDEVLGALKALRGKVERTRSGHAVHSEGRP